MKRFLLFTFETYYPNGGFQDFKGSFDSEDECDAKYLELQKLIHVKYDLNGHIFDSELNLIAKEYGRKDRWIDVNYSEEAFKLLQSKNSYSLYNRS